LPAAATEARQIVLLVLDGLGWEQLRERPAVAPVLAAMTGGPITSVVPSTTATALTSIATGTPPCEHGVVGYRVRVAGTGPDGEDEVLNILRWRTASGDASERVPPDSFSGAQPFAGEAATVISRGEFAGTGFTRVHLAGAKLVGWRLPSTLVVEVRAALAAGDGFIYAYYDGIDRVAHEFGLGDHYEAELRAADRLVADLISELPPDAALVVTADHGQVDVGDRVVQFDPEVLDQTCMLSGEGRFRWLHASSGVRADRLADRTSAAHGDTAWVCTRDEAEANGWFGGPLSDEAVARLGDVIVAAHQPVTFYDPSDPGEIRLRSRHGSLTAAEMYVPLLVTGGP
jgi:predicted AlkP superfamily pyrophosphatase or phosphodiesterase